MKSYERLLLENKAWVEETLNYNPHFFEDLDDEKTPEFLWIGGVDGILPSNVLTNTAPGEIFVHRNLGNIVVANDFNFLSVLYTAVVEFKVKHIIVCGHYTCQGVASALNNQESNIINEWVQNIRNVHSLYKPKFDKLSPKEKQNKLVELNVKHQVKNLAQLSLIKDTWQNDSRPMLHGWVYALKEGRLKPLIKVEPKTALEDIKIEF